VKVQFRLMSLAPLVQVQVMEQTQAQAQAAVGWSLKLIGT
jgi:hypothetical protein